MIKFDISNNKLLADGGKSLAEALTGNNVMQELNISSNSLGRDSGYRTDPSGVSAISNAIPTMRALSTLDISNNSIPNEQQANLKSICNSKNLDLGL